MSQTENDAFGLLMNGADSLYPEKIARGIKRELLCFDLPSHGPVSNDGDNNSLRCDDFCRVTLTKKTSFLPFRMCRHRESPSFNCCPKTKNETTSFVMSEMILSSLSVYSAVEKPIFG